jgi:hypothetical protein
MGQINVSADNQLIAALDRVASARGVSRPDLLRSAMLELVEAHDGDRLAFAREDGLRLDTSLSSLAAQLREAIIELDRTQRENSRIAKRLIEASNGGEEVAREAEARLTERINAQLLNGYAPFSDDIADLVEKVDGLPVSCAAVVGERLASTEQQIAAIEKAASEPRTATYYYLSSKSRVAMIGLLLSHLLILALGFTSGFYVADTGREEIGNNASSVSATPGHACSIVNAAFKTSDCKIPNASRKRAVDHLRQEQRR